MNFFSSGGKSKQANTCCSPGGIHFPRLPNFILFHLFSFYDFLEAFFFSFCVLIFFRTTCLSATWKRISKPSPPLPKTLLLPVFPFFFY